MNLLLRGRGDLIWEKAGIYSVFQKKVYTL
jgi:hypothetical protein